VVGARGARDRGYPEAARAFAAGTVGPVVLLAGPERLYAEELIDSLLEATVPEAMRAFNYTRCRGGEDPLEAVLGAAGTLPMFADRRLVVVVGADGFSRPELERLAEYIAHPSPSTILVLTSEETGERVPAALRKAPERYVLWRPFREEAVQWAIRRARRTGREMPPEVAEELFDLCAGDSGDGRAALSDLAIEVEKICLATGERKTIASDDLKVVGRHAEARVLYQVEAAVAERKLPEALSSLSAALLFPRENGAVRIVAMLGERFRKMLVARDRLDAGASPREAVAGMWFPGAAGAAPFLRSVGLFRRAELSQALVELARLDRALKTGRAEPESVHLEALLQRICSGAAGTTGRPGPGR
jgi:DNA polymerase III subunit delta